MKLNIILLLSLIIPVLDLLAISINSLLRIFTVLLAVSSYILLYKSKPEVFDIIFILSLLFPQINYFTGTIILISIITNKI